MNKRAIAETPAGEMDAIRAGQQREVSWWAQYPEMASVEQIDALVEQGEAQRIVAGVGYKVSEKVPKEFRVLRNSAHAVLGLLAARFQEAMERIGKPGLFLVVSSMARTIEYQRTLIAQGFPALDASTHVRGGAFDVGRKWFADNDPDAVRVFEELLAEMMRRGEINYMIEETIGAWHVAAKPEGM